MFKIVLLTAVLFFIPLAMFPATRKTVRDIDPKLKLLKQQVIKDILAPKTNEKETRALADAQLADGSWPDIDYADKTRGGWPVNDHLVRLNSMAIAYKQAGSPLAGNTTLEKKIMAGLNFWCTHDFICPNWWYPQIGVPKALAPIMLLMEDKLTQAQLAAGVKILERAKIGMTGQNKVWLSGNVIYRSLLTGDTAAVEAAVTAISGEIVVSQGEGIQPDYSFHQHGTQQQFGNYGSAYAADMLKWAEIFQRTAYQFDAAKISILRGYLLEGMRWITWKHKMDISACGRQLFPGAQTDKANSIERIFNKMPLVDPAYKDRYLAGMNDFSGNNHFWKSDMTVHRRNNFYSSVKMSSRRVGGAESCNDENIQGYHLGDGATYFYQSNEEYTDIFPFWDWKMIPGTTAFHDDIPLPVLPCSGYNIASDFVGGVSDGHNGIAALTYNRDSLQSQKAWFFFEDAIICLGAGIHAGEDKPIRTTINQVFLKGSVQVKQAGSPELLPTGQHSLEKVEWVLHDNWGYYFPGHSSVTLVNREQEGDWHQVLKRMPATPIKASLFTLWIDQRSQSKMDHYGYYVFPAATAATIAARGAAIEITANSSLLQVVENPSKQMAGLVFVQAGMANTKNFGSIRTDKPCIVMMTKKYALLQVALADPTHQLTSIGLTLPGNKKCPKASTTYNKAGNSTLVTIALPQGPEAGKTVTLIIE